MSVIEGLAQGTHSAYETFDTCPRMYQAKYITKEVEFKQTPEAEYGDEVHNEFEAKLKQGGLPDTRFKSYWPLFKAVASQPGETIAEGKCAIDPHGAMVDYWDKEAYWLRGKVDVTVVDGSVAKVFDWKTGKKKQDNAQLRLYSLFTLARFPQVDKVLSGYVWLKSREITKPLVVTREEMGAVAEPFKRKGELIARAQEVDHFPEKPSGLCNGWCDVTSCRFWKPKRR